MSFADKLSSLRIILIPFFISLLIYSRSNPNLKYITLAVFMLAVLTDFFDGLVARIKNEKTELGKVIDPLADKLFLLTAFTSLYLLKFGIPLLLVLVVVSRDLIILLGIVIINFLKIKVSIQPSIWGKLTTFCQMFAILVVLLEKQALLGQIVFTVAIFFTVYSGIDYVARGVRSVNDSSSTGN